MIRIGGLIALLLGLTACTMPDEIKENQITTARVNQSPGLIQHHYVEVNNYSLHYVSAGETSQPSVVFVHGTPGSWNSFAPYFEQQTLLDRFQLVSLDRPGWGESGYPKDEFPVTLSGQSNLIGPMLEKIWQESGNTPFILVGHSLGGSLVPKLAADYPQYVRGVIILAGDISPKLAEARWYNRVLSWLPQSWVPSHWYHSNQEVLALTDSLSDIQKDFVDLEKPLIIIQGTEDDLVWPENANYAQSLFQHSNPDVHWLQGAGHIINLTHVNEVVAAIEQMDKRTQ